LSYRGWLRIGKDPTIPTNNIRQSIPPLNTESEYSQGQPNAILHYKSGSDNRNKNSHTEQAGTQNPQRFCWIKQTVQSRRLARKGIRNILKRIHGKRRGRNLLIQKPHQLARPIPHKV
jgi:hypothetical protein